jgi:hypothetical protein
LCIFCLIHYKNYEGHKIMDYSRKVFSLFLLLVLTACNSIPTHRVHHTQLTRPTPEGAVYPVLLLPVDISVKEMSASGLTQEVGSWSREAKGHVEQAIADQDGALGRLRPVELPPLTEEEQELVEQYIALYDTVAGSALLYSHIWGRTPAWKHKVDHFDYTLGPGLAFLADKTGVERALFITGEDTISTGGRKVMFVVAAALGGVAIPMGNTVLVAGVVDLRTGDLHWINSAFSGGAATLRNPEDVHSLFNGLFDSFPGVEEHAKRQNISRQ